jgi:hypothetical protein
LRPQKRHDNFWGVRCKTVCRSGLLGESSAADGQDRRKWVMRGMG